MSCAWFMRAFMQAVLAGASIATPPPPLLGVRARLLPCVVTVVTSNTAIHRFDSIHETLAKQHIGARLKFRGLAQFGPDLVRGPFWSSS